MPIEIPLEPTASQNFVIDLEQITYNLTLVWNSREECYYLDIGDAENNPIIYARKLLPVLTPFRRYAQSNLPPGDFLVVDVTEQNERPEFEEIGTRYILVYFTEEEVNELTS